MKTMLSSNHIANEFISLSSVNTLFSFCCVSFFRSLFIQHCPTLVLYIILLWLIHWSQFSIWRKSKMIYTEQRGDEWTKRRNTTQERERKKKQCLNECWHRWINFFLFFSATKTKRAKKSANKRMCAKSITKNMCGWVAVNLVIACNLRYTHKREIFAPWFSSDFVYPSVRSWPCSDRIL